MHISDIVPDKYKKRAVELSEDHVNWFFSIIRPLLLTFSQHHYRHGFEDADNKEIDMSWLNKLAKVEIKNVKYSNPTLTENNDSREGKDQLHCHSKSNNPHENN